MVAHSLGSTPHSTDRFPIGRRGIDLSGTLHQILLIMGKSLRSYDSGLLETHLQRVPRVGENPGVSGPGQGAGAVPVGHCPGNGPGAVQGLAHRIASGHNFRCPTSPIPGPKHRMVCITPTGIARHPVGDLAPSRHNIERQIVQRCVGKRVGMLQGDREINECQKEGTVIRPKPERFLMVASLIQRHREAVAGHGLSIVITNLAAELNRHLRSPCHAERECVLSRRTHLEAEGALQPMAYASVHFSSTTVGWFWAKAGTPIRATNAAVGKVTDKENDRVMVYLLVMRTRLSESARRELTRAPGDRPNAPCNLGMGARPDPLNCWVAPVARPTGRERPPCGRYSPPTVPL